MLSIAEIRQKYPDPWASNDPRRIQGMVCYCVGGAILLAQREDGLCLKSVHSFPSANELAIGLIKLQPMLSPSLAITYAEAITDSNDRKDFEMAWAFAEEAMADPQK